RSRRPQRKDECQNPRARNAKSPLHARGRRQRSRSRESKRPHERQREDRRYGGGGVRREDIWLDCIETIKLIVSICGGSLLHKTELENKPSRCERLAAVTNPEIPLAFPATYPTFAMRYFVTSLVESGQRASVDTPLQSWCLC